MKMQAIWPIPLAVNVIVHYIWEIEWKFSQPATTGHMDEWEYEDHAKREHERMHWQFSEIEITTISKSRD